MRRYSSNARKFPASGGGNTKPKPRPVKLPGKPEGIPVKLPNQQGIPVKLPSPRAGKPVKVPKPSRPVTGTDLADQAKPGGPTLRPSPRPGFPKPKPHHHPHPSQKPSAPNRVVNRHGVQSSTRAGSGGAMGGPAGKPSKPKTFKHPDGSIRPYLGRGAKPGGGGNAAPAKDPIESLVDEIIASRTQPLEERRRQTTEQSIGNITQTNRLGQSYNNQVRGIRQDANLDLGAAMTKAAELRGISQETIAANQEWLKSLMGPTAGGTGDADVAQAGAETLGATGAASDAMAQEIASRGGSLNDYMAKQQVVGRTHQAEMNQQELLRRSAAHRDIDGQIAGVKGGRAELLHGMRSAERDQQLKEAVAQQEWGLKASQFELQAQRAAAQAAYQQGQLELGADRNAIAAHNATKPAAAKPAKPAESTQGRFPGIPKRYDSAINDALKLVQSLQGKDKLEKPWRQSFEMLGARGLSPAYAAMVASRWFPESFTRSNPYNMRQMMQNRGVPPRIIKDLLVRHFGENAWALSARETEMGQTAQNILENAKG